MLNLSQVCRIQEAIDTRDFHNFIEEYAHDYFEENPEWDPLFIAYDKAVWDIEDFLRKQGVAL